MLARGFLARARKGGDGMEDRSLVEKAIEAIEAVFGDTCVSPEVTKDSLEELRDEIDLRLDCLEADGVQ